MTDKQHTLLCLGDSYTIGEGVPLHDSFPYLLVQLLRKAGFAFHAPEIVAKTGWTTAELLEHLQHTLLSSHYDFVLLLVGVNNQYRGMDTDRYAADFRQLLNLALQHAGYQNDHVYVLSIPHWEDTPFAEGRNTAEIASQIDQFNQVNQSIARLADVLYIDIAPGTKAAAHDHTLLANDRLHYSGIEHLRWANMVMDRLTSNL